MSRVCPRIVAGTGESRPGAICALALRLREHAQKCGLRIVSLTSSRIHRSDSRYLTLADQRGRQWLLRISNHYKPSKTGHNEPHFDLVSKDGVSGFEGTAAYLDRIAGGEVEWTPPQRSPMRRGQQR